MRRVLRSSAVAVFLFGLVAGCGSSDGGSSSTEAAAGGDVTVPAEAGGGTPVAVTAADKSDVVQSLTVEPVSVAVRGRRLTIDVGEIDRPEIRAIEHRLARGREQEEERVLHAAPATMTLRC